MDKYKEALEKARAEYEKARKQGYTWLMGLLEGMFPELKESEDERIRQAIIAVVEWAECFNSSSVTHEDAETMLAYLEKQKDKRELDFAEGKVEGVKQTCQEIKDAMSLFEPKDLTPFEFTFREYIDSAIRYCVSGEGYQQYIKEWAADLLNLEKQKEQKPIVTVDLEEAADTYANKYDDINSNAKTYVAFKAGAEWQRRQKPAVWSEEDEDMLNSCISSIEEAKENRYAYKETDGDTSYDHEIAWLKSLRPQQKQEWSKEDEMYLSQAIETLEHENYSILADKLKSLRPPQYCENCKLKRSVENWKPSEEQMEHLKRCFSHGKPHLPIPNQHVLESLYVDLEKHFSYEKIHLRRQTDSRD